MRSTTIGWRTCGTAVHVGSGALADVGVLLVQAAAERWVSAVLVVADERIGPIHGAAVRAAVESAGMRAATLEVSSGEAAKSLREVERCYAALADLSADREVVIVAVGGGAISDLAGFVAATWMRGCRLAICPTTIEAAVDASIGGKNAVNLASGKNLVGTFHHPFLVVVDPVCFRTLPVRDVRAGLAESVKHALLTDEAFVAWHEVNAECIERLDEEVIEELIFRNLVVKAGFVVGDETDTNGRRVFLNFGHTIGHALESCLHYQHRHGECVALGMVAALELSARVCGLERSVVDRVRRLLERLGLPVSLGQTVDMEEILLAIGLDKKSRYGRRRFVLLEAVGRPVLREDVPEAEIRAGIEAVMPGWKARHKDGG